MRSSADPRRRVLAGQAAFLGLFLGLLVVPASSVFLGEFGADQLPWTYIAVAAGSLVGTPLLARGVRRRTLAEIGVPLWSVIAVIVASGWVGLEWFDARWVSGPLFVLFPMGIFVGFFFIGGQAGRVFDLREMKEHFPRVVVGFPVGFLVAGVLGDVLISLLGGVERLLPVSAAAAAALAALIGIAARRFPDELGRQAHRAAAAAAVAAGAAGSRPVPVRRLLTNRYVALLLGYQMLSQLGTQLVDFLMFERAAARFEGDDTLGRFIARYTTGLNLLDLVFLLFVAGVLITRFGMRVGLTANPFIVTGLMVGAVGTSLATGIDGMAPFVFVLAARAFDIAFTDGATRTALNTAYQAVPPAERLAAQATIEGFGVPIALGLTGTVLLVLQQGLGVGAWGVSVLTVGVGVLWTAAGVLVFGAYRVALRDGLAHRVLSPAALDLDDPATVAELDRMLASDDARQVWSGLVAFGSLPDGVARLRRLARTSDRQIAVTALEQLVGIDPGAAGVEAAALADHADPAVRVTAMGVLLGAGDTGDPVDAIRDALDHPDADVRRAARRAAASSGRDDLVAPVVAAALGGVDPAGALAALAEAADVALTHLVAALATDDVPAAQRLVRAVSPSPAAADALAPFVGHLDRDLAIRLRWLVARSGSSPQLAGRIDALLADDATLAAGALAAMAVLPDDPRVAVLHRSLDDELAVAGRGALATLALAIDPALVADASRALRSGDERAIAQALESIEVQLGARRARLCMPVIDARRSPVARLTALRAAFDVPDHDLDAVLHDLEGDPSGRWRRPWLAHCAGATRLALAPT